MSLQVTWVLIPTFSVNLISTLSYSLQIAGVRTGSISVSLALFNVLEPISHTSNTFEDPLPPEHVERRSPIAASIATVVGMLIAPFHEGDSIVRLVRTK